MLRFFLVLKKILLKRCHLKIFITKIIIQAKCTERSGSRWKIVVSTSCTFISLRNSS